jgi:DNA polymerase-3 subunit alpha
MSETYGVMVYQEDVIKVAHHFAQISLSEADVLRRGMSGKYRSRKEFQLLEEKFFTNCAKLGYPKHVSERVWFEIESFSGYSFSKGHSASYAVESYQSLYLKAHFPIEFMVGVINNFGGFYKTEFYFNEARVGGAQLYAPCINRSEFLTTISGTDIFVGFIHIIGMNTQLGQQIVQERMQSGAYKGLDNFVRRVNIGLEPLLLLIKVGAFSSIGKNKKELLWAAHLYFGVAKQKKHYALGLFDNEAEHYSLPSLYHDPQEDVFDQFEHLGFTLCNPFRLISNEYVKTHTQSAIQLRDVVGKTICILGYMVTIKNTVTKDGNFMHFGTFYDPNCHVFDTVHFPPVAKKYPLRGRGHYKITGKVVDDFGYPMVEVTHLEKIPMLSRVQSPPVFT